ncbi:hypothetical protein [Pseudonocardia acidicola]|uniref:Uncharacterized protein n=1 Tax=Pseudonocardia acidicola TaxID=2724939 RepID=A0ABX1SJ98_9PSEU|nr:hypothetical protein [Pseudonocardia acidicola]NMI00898.1 hypothetical protein [Pseudonocardia acidicola]
MSTATGPEDVTALAISWLERGVPAAGLLGLLICAGMIVLGRRRRSGPAQDRLVGALTATLLVRSIRIVPLRRGEPLAAVATGLARFVLATALGVAVLQAALFTGDALAVALLGTGAGGGVSTLVAERLTGRDGLAEPFLLLLAAVCVLLLAAALWMVLVVRRIALLAIAATLPLAAAGSLTAGTRGWLVRLAPWAVALVVHKPAAALVFSVGAGYLRSPAAPTGVGGVLAGIVVLGLAVAVLPATLRLLSWTTVRAAGERTAPGGATAGAAVGAVRLTGRSRGASAVALAGFIENTGPGTMGARPAPPLPASLPLGPGESADPPPGAACTGHPAPGRVGGPPRRGGRGDG